MIVLGYIPNVGAGFAAVVIDVRALRESLSHRTKIPPQTGQQPLGMGGYPFYRH